MPPIPVRVALRRSLREVRHVSPVRPRRATGLVRAVYAQVERDFGMLAPPIGLHSPAPTVLAASWLMLRESLVASGAASRADREVVAAAVSRGNACPYCVEVHGMALGSLGRPADADAIGGDRIASIEDPATRVLAAWARGGPLGPDVPAGRLPGLVGVAVTFHYLNRMVNVFLGESPLPDAVPGSARATVRAVLGRVLRPIENAEPGDSLGLLPAASLPDDLAWANGDSNVGEAFARACAAVDAAGAASVPAGIRDLVTRELASWNGRPPGLSRAWMESAVSTLPSALRPTGRLALLVALSPAQVDDEIVAESRAGGTAGDQALVELVAWSSLTAARTLGVRMHGRAVAPRAGSGGRA